MSTLVSIVKSKKPKGLVGFNQRYAVRRGVSNVFPRGCCTVGIQSGSKSIDVVHSVERGKLVAAPSLGQAQPQGRPMALRVQDALPSEGLSVMEGIRSCL